MPRRGDEMHQSFKPVIEASCASWLVFSSPADGSDTGAAATILSGRLPDCLTRSEAGEELTADNVRCDTDGRR